MPGKTTEYGFKWEENGIRCVIQRTFCDRKHMCLTVFTDAGALDVYISPSGQVKTHMKKPSAKEAHSRISRPYLNEVLEQ